MGGPSWKREILELEGACKIIQSGPLLVQAAHSCNSPLQYVALCVGLPMVESAPSSKKELSKGGVVVNTGLPELKQSLA